MPEIETTLELPITISYSYSPEEGHVSPTSEHYSEEDISIEEVKVGEVDILEALTEKDIHENTGFLADVLEKVKEEME